MSLINDALNRAKQVQQTQIPSAPPNLPLRPIERPVPARSSAWILWVLAGFGLAAIIVIAGVILIFGSQFRAARGPAPDAPRAVVPTPIPVQAKANTEPNPAVNNTVSTQQNTIAEPTNAAPQVVAAPEPPKPPPLRLQGVVMGSRPSVMINGKTLFVGERIGEFRVSAITPTSATIVSSTETMVLTRED